MANTNPHRLISYSPPFHKDREGRMVIYPKDLNIVWGNDSRYWTVSNEENLPAYLNQVYWLEVTGSVGNTDPSKGYEVGFRISLTPDSFGWTSAPLYIMVKRGKEGKYKWKKFSLDQDKTEGRDIVGKLSADFENIDKGEEHEKIYFGLYEVWSGKWKGGLIIHYAYVKELP